MRVAIDAVLESGKLCEAAICYTGNLASPHERKYTLDYYLQLARALKSAGTHVIGIKDMAGLFHPPATSTPVRGPIEEGGLPVAFRIPRTPGISAPRAFSPI